VASSPLNPIARNAGLIVFSLARPRDRARPETPSGARRMSSCRSRRQRPL